LEYNTEAEGKAVLTGDSTDTGRIE